MFSEQMAIAQYACECGSTQFMRYIGDKTIYCKKCGKAAPPNVKFKDEYSDEKSI